MAMSDYTFTVNSANLASSLLLTKPAGIQAGEKLVIIVLNDDHEGGSGSHWATPAGWVEEVNEGDIGADIRMSVFTRTATGDANDKDETVSMSAYGPDELVGWYLRVPDADTSSALDATSGTTSSSTTSSSFAAPALTSTVDGCLIIAICGFDGTDGHPFTPSGTGWPTSIPTDQEFREPDSAGPGGCTGAWVTKILASAGDSSDCLFAASSTDTWCVAQIAIAPSAVARTLHTVELDKEVYAADLALGFSASVYRGATPAVEEEATEIVALGSIAVEDIQLEISYPNGEPDSSSSDVIKLSYADTVGTIKESIGDKPLASFTNYTGTTCA